MSKEKTFDDLMKEALVNQSPSFEIPRHIREHMYNALKFASPMTLGISGSEMRDLATKLLADEPLNCYQYAVASNSLEARTPNDLDLTMDAYLNLMADLEYHAVLFNRETENIRNTVIREMAKKNMRPAK